MSDEWKICSKCHSVEFHRPKDICQSCEPYEDNEGDNPMEIFAEVDKFNKACIKKAKKLYDEEIPNIIKQFGTWATTDFGIECLVLRYPISKEQLTEKTWPLHMSSKYWVDMNDFLKCFYFGRQHHYPNQYDEFGERIIG